MDKSTPPRATRYHGGVSGLDSRRTRSISDPRRNQRPRYGLLDQRPAHHRPRGALAEPLVVDGFESFAFSQFYPLHLQLAVGAVMLGVGFMGWSSLPL